MMDQDQLNSRLAKAGLVGDLTALLQALGEGANPKANNSRALISATIYGHAQCVKALIPVSDPLSAGSLALRWAAGNGHGECVRLLLPVSDPLAVDAEGLDAATSARKKGHIHVASMIEAFIESQALSGCAQKANMKPRVKSAL